MTPHNETEARKRLIEERDVIAACIKKRCDHPDRDYGYIQEDSA